jgi:hypothetical protein
MMSEAALPQMYAAWLQSITGGPIPAETKATCENCAMLAPPEKSPGAIYFDRATKCCAFQPHLPNFVAGQILDDSDPAIAQGREKLEQRISRRAAITPGWAGPGAVFSLLYRNTPNVFGRAPGLRCEFLSPTGECGVWKHRPGVCATWHCKHVRGDVGFRFWSLADRLLRQVEQELSLWCLAELKTGSAEVGDMDSGSLPHVSELGGEIDTVKYREWWGDWEGREIDFYRACARLVKSLTWEQVEQVCGPRVRILAGLLRDAYLHLTSDAIPERLRLREFRITGLEGSGYRVVAYSPYDPLIMPEPLTHVLHYFDGRLTEEALEAIFSKEGVCVDLSLVRRMVDFGILQACVDKNSLSVLG